MLRAVLRSRWQALRSAFWALPALITAAMIGLAILLVEIDRASGADGTDWAFSGDAEAARGILSTVAGSLITVAGLSFSITIVTLQLVSGQFTPRALRGFLSDRINQSVAGAFVGTFAYCLIVLRSIRSEEPDGSDGFVPALAVSSAIALALGALALLLLFIHHMGQLIQVSNITAQIARATLAAAGRLYPEAFGAESEGAGARLERWREEGAPDRVEPARPGYVRRIDEERVAEALPDGARALIAVQPGRFVTEGAAAVEVWPAGRLTAEGRNALRDAVEVESERDLEQDVGFGIRQLADIALRALSPGVNDPTTAVTCIGYLQAVLERLAARGFPANLRVLPDRGLELVASRASFSDHAEEAFGELGLATAPLPRVAAALQEALAAVARAARAAGAEDRAATVEGLAARASAEAARRRAP